METTASITWTPEKLKQLERMYAEAVASDTGQFVFEGHDLLTSYAKYLIEYLKGRFA